MSQHHVYDSCMYMLCTAMVWSLKCWRNDWKVDDPHWRNFVVYEFMHGACGSISNAHHANSWMCPSHRKSSEQLYVYVSLLIHINTYIHQITYNLDYISMPTLLLERKKNHLWQSNLPCQPRLRVPRRHAKVPPGRLSARHRATPANGSPGRTGFPKRISLQTRLAYGVCSCWCFYFLFSSKEIQRNKWHRSWGQKNCSKICLKIWWWIFWSWSQNKSKLLAWSPGLGILLGAEPSSTSLRFRSVLLKKTCCSYHGLIMICMRHHIQPIHGLLHIWFMR